MSVFVLQWVDDLIKWLGGVGQCQQLLALQGSPLWPPWGTSNIPKTNGHCPVTPSSVDLSLTQWCHPVCHLAGSHTPFMEVLSELCRVKLTVSPYHLSPTTAQYKRYCFSLGLPKPEEKRVKVIKTYPWPSTKKQAPSWGWCGNDLYRTIFFVDFPLSDLT